MVIPDTVLEAFRFSETPIATPTTSGLINRSWSLRTAAGGPLGVLQWLNTAIFDAALHDNIEAVTGHLASRGVATPRLVRTVDGALFHRDASGDIWRALTFVGDRTVDKLADPADAAEAGALVARFHTALADFDTPMRPIWSAALRAGGTRDRFHDTAAYMAALQASVDAHQRHRLYDATAALAEQILTAYQAIPTPSDLPTRLVHGDLKISNVRFTGPRAVALIDLDTLGYGTLDAELGDALRSWCNPSAEDSLEPKFDLDLLTAALRGYATAGTVTEAEWASILPGIERITLELASRFARDAVEESYFGYDPKFGTRGDHNLLRARGQLALARAVHAAAPEAWGRIAQLPGR
jgi:Ser/Thr protein kinase RdoA (MazF antagonist)